MQVVRYENGYNQTVMEITMNKPQRMREIYAIDGDTVEIRTIINQMLGMSDVANYFLHLRGTGDKSWGRKLAILSDRNIPRRCKTPYRGRKCCMVEQAIVWKIRIQAEIFLDFCLDFFRLQRKRTTSSAGEYKNL